MLRRTRRVVGDNNVVVCYTIGPRMVNVEVWNSDEMPYAVGAEVEVEVYTTVYNGRVAINLSRNEEEF